MKTALDTILDYHQRSKHQFQRYASGPDGMDWKNHPDPFRTFAGSERLELPLLGAGAQPRYAELYQPGAIAAQAFTLPNIAALLELSLGLSAWKQHEGSRWALRCNPAPPDKPRWGGGCHWRGCSGIRDGVHHYLSRDHLLEQRCRFVPSAHADARILPPASFLVGLSSIHWREAWKYGERAFRYCQHDVGHAIAALRYAAAMLGWQVHVLEAWSDADTGAILGVEREADFGAAEREHPDIMLQVTTARSNVAAVAADALLAATRGGIWQGRANRLSPHPPQPWPVIEEVARASRKPHTRPTAWQAPILPTPINSTSKLGAAEIIKQRRSAQEFDASTSITSTEFYRMLDMTLPRANVPPWDAIAWEPRIHLLLFVHRVEGLAPGLYVFLRNPAIGTG